MISIIIPTLNEENYLPLLLESIKKQDFNDYEIIVSDAGSQDRTLQIARKYNCKITKGGLPAKGRNEGAKLAKGDVLLFLDADVILQDDSFLSKALKEFKENSLNMAGFNLVLLPIRKFSLFFMNVFYNIPVSLLKSILPHAAMGILMEKSIFDQVGGFDETNKLAEDHYLIRKAKKMTRAKFGVIKSVKVFVSDRRFEKDGWLKTSVKYLLCELHLIFLGPVRSDIFHYKFGHYKKEKIK